MTAHNLQPGTTLRNGRYTIRQVLGKGSFGITYRATTKASVQGPLGNIETEINVAVKEFYMSELNRRGNDGCSVTGVDSSIFANYQHRFRREAENLASLQHDHIVRVAEVFDENNTTYFVMQYIDGQDLDGHIAKRGRLPEEEAIVILRQVAEALAYMHDHRMLHLDIKPKNIMLDTAGNAYLVDFGLSKHFNAKGEPESSSTIGLGTKGYAPMEQASYVPDGKSFPATLDIYALGATLYKMLTGKCAPDATEVFNEGLPLAPLEDVGVSKNLQQLILKAMAPQRRQRYQTIGELFSSLSSSIVTNNESTQIVNEDTELNTSLVNDNNNRPHIPKTNPHPCTTEKKSFFSSQKRKRIAIVIGIIIVLTLIGFFVFSRSGTPTSTPTPTENTAPFEIALVLPYGQIDTMEIDGYKCHISHDTQGNFVGAAIEAGNDKGFGGHLQLVVGFDKEGKIFGYRILESHETPGLGAKADQWFLRGGEGCIIGSIPPLKVKKDNGSVDAITGATLTSRAFLEAVNEAYEVFKIITIKETKTESTQPNEELTVKNDAIHHINTEPTINHNAIYKGEKKQNNNKKNNAAIAIQKESPSIEELF